MVNTEATNYVCGLRREDFQTIIDGKRTDLYILKNAKGNEIAFTNYGGAIVAIMVPDRDGNLANIIQGHDNIRRCYQFARTLLFQHSLVAIAIVLLKDISNWTEKNTI